MRLDRPHTREVQSRCATRDGSAVEVAVLIALHGNDNLVHLDDWNWPKRVDREAINELFTFGFLAEGGNVVVLGPTAPGRRPSPRTSPTRPSCAGTPPT